jgi:pimeloyl-ACP methyl ester carboxylesterase
VDYVVSAGAVHVRVDGPAAGPVVLLLHGFASSLHSFDRVAASLSTACRVVRVDLLGHGASPRVADRYDSESQAVMVGEVLDQLDLTATTMVGHSFGADVAIAVAERSSQVTGLVVIGQAPDYTAARIPRGNWLMLNAVSGPLLRRLAPAPLVRRAARFAFAPGARPAELFDHPGRIVEDFRATSPTMYRTVLVDRPLALAEQGLDARIRRLGIPTMVVLGAQDQLYPLASTRPRYAALPGVQVETLVGSGHSPNLEQPEQVAALIRDFVR